jgi:hypothetical protein
MMGDAMKTMFASLATFVALGVFLADVKISYYFDFDRPEKQPASGPADSETELYAKEKHTFRVAAYDFLSAQFEPGMIFSEIGRGMRDLTSFKRCWLLQARQDHMDGDVARLCTALTGPL